MTDLKDVRLWQMSQAHNVAQFVSFSNEADPHVRYSRVIDDDFDERIDLLSVVSRVMKRWGSTANVRSFLSGQEQGNPFYYGLKSVEEVCNTVRGLSSAGYYTIVNETVDVEDGGVSGVAHGNVIEFSPEDTPRAVEKPGVVSIRRDWGLAALEKVYGFLPELPQQPTIRTEFSIHPKRVGYRQTHTLVWETNEQFNPPSATPVTSWPNNFSRFIGDKAFGLLLADVMGIQVPRTLIIPRHVAPFTIGRSTGTHESWLRTSPREKQPGKYSTLFGWTDPYKLMEREDPEGNQLASVLVQEAVDPAYSGATGVEHGKNIVQGVAGRGDEFMLGSAAPAMLPEIIERDVLNTLAHAGDALGARVNVEWVHDGRRAWIVQMTIDRSHSAHGVLIPGSPVKGWISFDPSDGLDDLRKKVNIAIAEGKGINVLKAVGQTSHVGDIIRGAGIPARYVPG